MQKSRAAFYLSCVPIIGKSSKNFFFTLNLFLFDKPLNTLLPTNPISKRILYSLDLYFLSYLFIFNLRIIFLFTYFSEASFRIQYLIPMVSSYVGIDLFPWQKFSYCIHFYNIKILIIKQNNVFRYFYEPVDFIVELLCISSHSSTYIIIFDLTTRK